MNGNRGRDLGWAAAWRFRAVDSRSLRFAARWCAVGCLAAVTACPLALAQAGHTPSPPSQRPEPNPVEQPQFFTNPDPFSTAFTPPPTGELSGEIGRIMDNESCNSWTESSVHSPTVSAKRLVIPGKAAGEYQKGCGALKGRHWTEAETHLRRAIELYPDYASAWVLLGQTFISQDKRQDAKDACTKAKEIDPGYVASYLCLAEFAANDSDWPEVAKASAQALEIDPIGNPYALYYAADAGFHQRQLSQAEMKAQAGVKLDEWHHIPELHLLLAQIYDAAGNVVGEAAQLKEFLKVAANSKDAAKAKSMLALLETTPVKPAAPSSEQSSK